jgi:uncharacterized protein YsxB (DUF464 family)
VITVNLTQDGEKKTLSLRLKGHAGQAEVGHDIVCASATILAYTVAQIVKVMESHKELTRKPTIKLKKGDIEITCRCKTDEGYAEALHTYFVAQVGYSLLAHNYPQYVALNSLGEPVKA